MKYLKKTLWAFYFYSGLAALTVKFTGRKPNDVNYHEPPLGLIWLLAILYIAAYNMADRNYNETYNKVKSYEERTYNELIASEKDTCEIRLEYYLKMRETPERPELIFPKTVLDSVLLKPYPAIGPDMLAVNYIEDFALQNYSTAMSSYYKELKKSKDTDRAIIASNFKPVSHRSIPTRTDIAFHMDLIKTPSIKEFSNLCEPFLGIQKLNQKDAWKRYSCIVFMLDRTCPVEKQSKIILH